ncbi:alpha/beta fold hydrolase [Streptomyces sp. NPDC058691]|uniref:alpha/beta fold hydrolase n=1 Tax=Streptomyces sp. NPDC058691 TaxID=3346601 RepID=UPI00364B1BA9
MTTTTYALIPGAGGDSGWYWQLVVAELRRRGHEALAVELPAADDSAGLEEYADAVAAGVGDRAHLVLVAQSMAGFTAPLVCDRLKDRVDLIVLVNAMIPAPGETAGDWWANTGQPEARRALDLAEGRPADADFDPLVTFFHDLPQPLVDQALAREPRQSDTPFGDPFPLPAWPDVPTRVVVGRDDRLFPEAFQRRVARDRLGIDADVLPGGHLVALSNPVGLAELLVRYRTH